MTAGQYHRVKRSCYRCGSRSGRHKERLCFLINLFAVLPVIQYDHDQTNDGGYLNNKQDSVANEPPIDVQRGCKPVCDTGSEKPRLNILYFE